MTVESTTARVQYATNGTTGPFTVPFKFLADADLEVIYTDEDGNETTLTLTTHYTVTGAGGSSGTVTTVTAYPSGGYITVLRNLDLLQQTDWEDGDALPASSIETAFDRLTMIAQQQGEKIDRALVFAPSDPLGSEIPAVAIRADKLLGFDSTGAISMTAPTSGSAAALALDLASSATSAVGAGQIGYNSTRAYSHNTVGGRLNEAVSFSEFLSSSQKADIEAGTLLVDCTTALQNAIDSGEVIELLAGSVRLDGTVVSSVVPRLVGKGRSKTILRAYSTGAVNVFEFNNAAGSYDEGLILEGFTLQGPASGSAVGLKVEGAVYVNSRMRDILVKDMGSHGVYVDDCLTMYMEAVRAQTNGGTGILVDQSNGIVMHSCSAESNTSHGIYLNDGGAAFGENFGATLIGCHSEANGTSSGGHAVYIKGHYGVSILGGWFQCESGGGALANSAIKLDGVYHSRIHGALLNTGGTTTNLVGLELVDSLFNDATIYAYGFASGKDWTSNAASNRNRVAGTSNQGQGGLSMTDSSTLGNVRVNWSGSGGNYGQEVVANLHSMFCGANEMVRVVSTGIQLRNHTTTTSATAGGATALPATPTGYLTVNINGTDRKVAYY